MPWAAFAYRPASRFCPNDRPRYLSNVRSAFAWRPGPAHSDRLPWSMRRRVMRLTDLPTLTSIPDKVAPAPLGPTDWLEGPLSARLGSCVASRRRSVDRSDSGRSALAAGTRPHAPFRSFLDAGSGLSGRWEADLRPTGHTLPDGLAGLVPFGLQAGLSQPR